ncbi:MAG: dihydrodipicolinate synthase family protein [Clostridiales bacterium]|nr:dihydrodipicolinate synthase family protein [Clostridiales bacterium]
MDTTSFELLMKGAFIPAMPLVLDSDRRFDEAKQRRLIRYYLESGVDGLAVGVHTTQFAIRDPKVGLFERVLQVSIDEMRSYSAETLRPVLAVAGVCGEEPQALYEARTAKRFGYDIALLSPGGLDHLSEAEMISRTRAVADVMDVMGFYLQVAVGGRAFSYDYWRQVCSVEGVKAIKCAAFDRYRTVDVARAIAYADHEIALYTGNDDNIVVDLLTRYRFGSGKDERTVITRGGLLGHWCAWTHTAVEIFKRVKAMSGQETLPGELLELAAKVTDVNGAFFDAHNGFKGCIAGMHEVLRRQGLMDGVWCLDPAEGLGEGQAEEITRVYGMYPELSDDAFVKQFLESYSQRC